MIMASLHWRAMTAIDLPAVKLLADRIHPTYPEDAAVFADRLAVHCAGCFMLRHDDALIGYVISHPWHFMQPPKLNARLGAPASRPTTYYIHDLALLPEARRTGAAAYIVAKLVTHATHLQLPNMTLVAVNNSVHFWQRQGFEIVSESGLDHQLRSYDQHARFMRRDLP
ncbi:MAG: GNAT family N-acetyltransferase [Tardiphaga sp.]|nr:GNAT family N-acetyltransferase [Tardiphaga sp.]